MKKLAALAAFAALSTATVVAPTAAFAATAQAQQDSLESLLLGVLQDQLTYFGALNEAVGKAGIDTTALNNAFTALQGSMGALIAFLNNVITTK